MRQMPRLVLLGRIELAPIQSKHLKMWDYFSVAAAVGVACRNSLGNLLVFRQRIVLFRSV